MGRGRNTNSTITLSPERGAAKAPHYFTKNGLCTIPDANYISDEQIDQIASLFLKDWEELRSEVEEQTTRPIDEDMALIDPEYFSPDAHEKAAITHSLKTKYGDLFEEVAFALAKIAYGATKPEKIRSSSSKSELTEGHDFNIDIIEKDTIIRYQVECKSSDNWGNQASQKGTRRKFQEGALKFKKEYSKEKGYSARTPINVVVCRKGETTSTKTRFGYYQLAGKDYWHFISGDENMRSRWLESLKRVKNARL